MTEVKVFKELQYLISYPENFRPEEKYPLVVFLHGAGTRSENIEVLQQNACVANLKKHQDRGFVLLAPLCSVHDWTEVMERVIELVDNTRNSGYIDISRVYLTGNSMGGYGTFAMGMAYPNFFSAVAPISGGGMPWRYTNLKTTPIWAAHGDLDDLVPLECTKMVVDSVNAHGGNAKFTVCEGFGHNDGIDEAYRNTEIIDWLLDQRRTTDEIAYEFCRECF